MRTAANLSSTLLTHHVAAKLEQILDKETKITHQSFADQIESRIGSGDGERAPDARVWSKGRGIGDVRLSLDLWLFGHHRPLSLFWRDR